MKIIELEWIIDQWDDLTSEEQAMLDYYSIREHYKKGELHMQVQLMMQVMGIIIGIYEKYNPNGGDEE